MTTREGTLYKRTRGEEAMSSPSEEGNASVSELVRLLFEDRRKREEELAEERARRDSENAKHAKQVEEPLEIMKNLVERSVERSVTRDSDAAATATKEKRVLTKLGENEDIEAYLTTFERLMTVYRVPQERWAVKLVPQLTGRVQQAYAAMATADAGVCSKVKKAILRRYDISEETYRQRFRAARRKEGEAYIELATRLADLFKKWTIDCDTVEAIAEKMLIEQLLNIMPADLRVWLSEKPTTGLEVGRLADDYLLARKRNRVDYGWSGDEEVSYMRTGGASGPELYQEGQQQ